MADTVCMFGAGINRSIHDGNGLLPPLSTDFFQQALRHHRIRDDHYKEKLTPVFEYIARYWKLTCGQDRSILKAMKIATGKVVGGKVVLEGAAFEEGTSVTVLARDEEDAVSLTPEEEAELLLAIAEADRGELVSAEEVLAKLAHRHG